MKKLLKWIYKPSGLCPVQAEGYFMGNFFYFRSRGSTTSIDFAKTQEDWEKSDYIRSYILKKSNFPEAGYFSRRYCYILIFKGLVMFLLGVRSNDKFNQEKNLDF